MHSDALGGLLGRSFRQCMWPTPVPWLPWLDSSNQHWSAALPARTVPGTAKSETGAKSSETKLGSRTLSSMMKGDCQISGSKNFHPFPSSQKCVGYHDHAHVDDGTCVNACMLASLFTFFTCSLENPARLLHVPLLQMDALFVVSETIRAILTRAETRELKAHIPNMHPFD